MLRWWIRQLCNRYDTWRYPELALYSDGSVRRVRDGKIIRPPQGP